MNGWEAVTDEGVGACLASATVTAAALNFRNEASLSGTVLGTLARGVRVFAYAVQPSSELPGEWAVVVSLVRPDAGYVHSLGLSAPVLPTAKPRSLQSRAWRWLRRV
jgi:hypothetical protein